MGHTKKYLKKIFCALFAVKAHLKNKRFLPAAYAAISKSSSTAKIILKDF
jgi:hypothetical protein